ncbi:Tat pathway signal sequence domain protein [Kitasatospora sp. NPDC002040]|uniref:Tat pathway signal sequence domain protein n=1 Tax=Kitasatospora sp. NPDC002040 TaxID=3154661 RepID=UPI00332FF6C1
MSGERRDGTGAGGLGPIEAGEGTFSAPSGPPAPGPSARRRLTGRQRFAVAALSIAGITLVTVRLLDQSAPPAAAPVPLAPYPALVTKLTYRSVTAGEPGGFSMLMSVEVAGSHPVEVIGLSQPYPGLRVSAHRALPYEVMAGQSAPLTLDYRVLDCIGLPLDAGLPYLDVTLRNIRAIQTVSQIPGDGYALALSRQLHIACPKSDMRTSLVDGTPADASVR